MKQYEFEFSYQEPHWGDALIPAEDEIEAREEFEYYIKEFYPEAMEVEITDIKETDIAD